MWLTFAFFCVYSSVEHLDFYRDVKKYKENYAPSVAKAYFQKLYYRYILRESAAEVNIGHDVRNELEAALKSGMQIT